MMVKQKIENVSFIQDNYKRIISKLMVHMKLLMFIMMYPKTNDDFIETLCCDHFKKYQREPHTL